MKKALVLLFTITLASCQSNYYKVKLQSGAIVKAYDEDTRSYNKGDTVCVHSTYANEWFICNDDIIKDTTYYYSINNSNNDGTAVKRMVRHRVGKIVK